MNKKLFENIAGNQFKLSESDWATTQEHNEELNRQIRKLKYIVEYVTAASKSPHATPEVKNEVQRVIKDCEEYSDILDQGYLSSGYQYDDNDTRNKEDEFLDNQFDDERERARSGTSRAEEIEAEIRVEITKRHLSEHIKQCIEFFNEETAREIWPEETPEAEDLFSGFGGLRGDEWNPMSLSEYLNELAQAEHESAQDREMYGDDDDR